MITLPNCGASPILTQFNPSSPSVIKASIGLGEPPRSINTVSQNLRCSQVFVKFTKSHKNIFNHNVWEQRKVNEISSRFDNLRVPVAASLRIEGNTPYYGANGIQDYVEGFTHEGEFVLVAEDGANDLKNYPVQYVNGRIWVNNHAHVLQSNTNNETMFLKYLINSADIESLLVGGGRAKLNAEVLMNIDLIVPDKKEQKKISLLLSKVEELITLHQRK